MKEIIVDPILPPATVTLHNCDVNGMFNKIGAVIAKVTGEQHVQLLYYATKNKVQFRPVSGTGLTNQTYDCVRTAVARALADEDKVFAFDSAKEFYQEADKRGWN